MTTLNASKARIPTDAFNRVVYNGERVRIAHRNGRAAILVSEDDLKLIETIEDLLDLQAAEQALADMKARRKKSIPWEKVKERLALSS